MGELGRRKQEVVLWSSLVAGAFAVALLVRLRAHHRGLIYPDGYDYLLMARGIAAHLTPTVSLGPGGELFVPSVDAALKPLFPALVALFSPLWGLHGAANTLTAAGAAATVVLAGLLAQRLSGSHAAGFLAASAALLSPTLAYWSGFTGPDPVASALALSCALAIALGRPSLAGALGALCSATRPEWFVVFVGLGLAGLIGPSSRPAAHRALLTGAFTLGMVLLVLRPPLGVPPGGLLLVGAAIVAAAALQLGAAWAATAARRAVVVTLGCVCVVAGIALSGRARALAGLLPGEAPLLALAALGLLRASQAANRRGALSLLAAGIVLGATYFYRNAGSSRYVAEVLPLLCVLAGLAAAPWGGSLLTRRLPAVASGAALALLALLAPARPPLATDTFAALAPQLGRVAAGTLVTAAPEAYGYLLPDRPQRSLAPGARGLILLDGAQRAYSPQLTAVGQVVARLAAPNGFERPDGTLDTRPVELVRGVVVRTG